MRIAGGEYHLPKSAGPIVGQNRGEIEADPDIDFAIDDEAAFAKRGKPLPKNRVPPEFNVNSTLVTEIAAAAPFYPAERYHQDYFERNGGQPYCAYVVAPKVAKFRKAFGERLKRRDQGPGARDDRAPGT